MEAPIPRLPPIVGPPPAPMLPRLGDRKRQPGEPPGDEAKGKKPPPPATPPNPDDDVPIAPPDPDDAGSRIDLTA
ncbi:MAG TPA: hypothetical protein VKE69_10340 [Planctomycetota bacterium]|nr:hypothetical protein [Planctomycetota bacterium]